MINCTKYCPTRRKYVVLTIENMFGRREKGKLDKTKRLFQQDLSSIRIQDLVSHRLIINTRGKIGH